VMPEAALESQISCREIWLAGVIFAESETKFGTKFWDCVMWQTHSRIEQSIKTPTNWPTPRRGEKLVSRLNAEAGP
jgi:hypothetical protein